MKNLIHSFGTLLLIFMLVSCGKDVPPIIQVYVSAKKSDLYQSISMEHGKLKIFTSEDGGPEVLNYNGLDVILDLTTNDNAVLAGEVTFHAGSYYGVYAHIQKIDVVRIEGTELEHLFEITDWKKKFGQKFELLSNGHYRIDFIYDIDKSITMFSPTEYDFDTVVEVKVTQL